MLRLGDFLNDNWDGMMACGVLQRIPKLRKGWKITTSCGQTASIMEQALLGKSVNGGVHVDTEGLNTVLRMFEEHVSDNACLMVSLHLYGKATTFEGSEDISKVNFGHSCLIVRMNRTVMVVQSFIDTRRTTGTGQTISPGKTMSQCQPELHREAEDVVQALRHLIEVYTTAPPIESSEIKALPPLEWGKYRGAVELLLGYKLPEGIMESGILNKYRCGTARLQTAKLLENLRTFSKSPTDATTDDPWIHADRLPSQPLSSSAFLSRLFDDNWQSRVVRMRCTLAEASGIEL